MLLLVETVGGQEFKKSPKGHNMLTGFWEQVQIRVTNNYPTHFWHWWPIETQSLISLKALHMLPPTFAFACFLKPVVDITSFISAVYCIYSMKFIVCVLKRVQDNRSFCSYGDDWQDDDWQPWPTCRLFPPIYSLHLSVPLFVNLFWKTCA